MASYLMQARDSVAGTMHIWTAASPDWEGAGFPGPNAAVASTIAVVGTETGGGGATFLPYRIERALRVGLAFDPVSAGGGVSVVLSPDKTKLFRLMSGGTSDRIRQWTLSTPGDFTTASYDGFFDHTTQDGVGSGLAFNASGTRMYVVGDSGNVILQYNLGTAWEIVSSAPTYAGSASVSAQTTGPRGIALSPDGTKLLISSSGNTFQYTLSTPDEIIGGSLSYASVSIAVAMTGMRWINGLDGTPGGRLAYVAQTTAVSYRRCPTPYSISGSSAADSGTTFTAGVSPNDLHFTDDGLRMLLLPSNDLYEYYVSAAVPA